MSTVGLAIIARDEEQMLPGLLDSIEGAFDRVVLLDTGSTDNTIEFFQQWAREQAGMTFAVGHFTWVDDFAAARNAADDLLLYGVVFGPDQSMNRAAALPMVDWTSWADCDDRIENAGALRAIAADAPDNVGAVLFGYDYAQHPETGICVCHLRRERLVRAEHAGRWVHRVHEAQDLACALMAVPDQVCRWVHRKVTENPDAAPASNDRNLRILTRWDQEEPGNPRTLAYLGSERMARGDIDEAIADFERYVQVKDGWDEQRAQVMRKLAQCYGQKGLGSSAEEAAFAAMRLMPTWPDSYLTLAEAALERGEAEKARHWARHVLEAGPPETLLIINPLDYTVGPRRLIAMACLIDQRFDEGAAAAQEALQLAPGDPELSALAMQHRSAAKREHTATTFVMAAEQLVNHDEQLKALQLLDCVPHFAIDHARVVAMRSYIRERLLWLESDETFAEHYVSGGSKPEDFHDDERAEAICAYLPRVHFLKAGLRLQAEAIAA